MRAFSAGKAGVNIPPLSWLLLVYLEIFGERFRVRQVARIRVVVHDLHSYQFVLQYIIDARCGLVLSRRVTIIRVQPCFCAHWREEVQRVATFAFVNIEPSSQMLNRPL